MRSVQHIVSVSGGKDSTACYLLALQRGRPFRAVTADTGFEAAETYDWIQSLPDRAGGPVVEVVKADFSAQIARKRDFIIESWSRSGVPQERIDRALEVLHPTGIPFLDLCLWKGRFPSSQRRFCTEFLKSEPFHDQVMIPALEVGPVVRWQGERRDESKARSKVPMLQAYRTPHGRVTIYRPIIHWTADNVFALHRMHGLDPNPLYMQGMSRVGCLPCIMGRKAELAQISRRFPETVDRLMEWEALVADASKRGAASFFAGDTTPEGAEMAKAGVKGTGDDPRYPNAAEVFAWSETSRGGKQLRLDLEPSSGCSSEYGLCE